MRKVIVHDIDGTSKTYHSITDAAKAIGAGAKWASAALRQGYRCNGRTLEYAPPDADTEPHERKYGRNQQTPQPPKPPQQVRLEAILDALAPLMGRKEQEVRAFCEEKLRGHQVTKEKVHKCFGWWYTHQPCDDVVLMDSSEYIRRLNTL